MRTTHPLWPQCATEAKINFAKDCRLIADLLARKPELKKHFPDHRYLQLVELQHWCRNNQPQTIVELGSGFTTLVLSAYAAEFRGKRLITVEEDEGWLEAVKKDVPEWATVEWFSTPRVVENETVRYAELPRPGEIDLLYVDGPNGEYMGKSRACMDAIRLVESGVKVNNVLFDQRNFSVAEFKAKVTGYGFEPGASVELSTPVYLRPFRHHSWFWRK
jgi:predicted O-methyltransferase YrrM